MNDIYSQQNIDFLKDSVEWLRRRLGKCLNMDYYNRPFLEELLKEREKELEEAKMYFKEN